MAGYDDFKKKAKDALDSITDASVDAYKVAEEKTRTLAKKTKLRAGIVNDKATIRRLSVELGTRYHKKYKDDENSEFKQICDEISCAHDRIAAKEAEIAELKANACAKPECTETSVSESECCTQEAEQECCNNNENNENNEG